MPEAPSNRLKTLSDADFKKVLDGGRRFTLPPDWSLIWEGTTADKAYLIVDGEVSVRKHGEEIARLGPGDVIGEMGVVEHRLRSASVISLTPLDVVHYTAEGLQQVANDVPAFGEVLKATSEERRKAGEG